MGLFALCVRYSAPPPQSSARHPEESISETTSFFNVLTCMKFGVLANKKQAVRRAAEEYLITKE